MTVSCNGFAKDHDELGRLPDRWYPSCTSIVHIFSSLFKTTISINVLSGKEEMMSGVVGFSFCKLDQLLLSKR
jgi:hypothetical protein